LDALPTEGEVDAYRCPVQEAQRWRDSVSASGRGSADAVSSKGCPRAYFAARWLIPIEGDGFLAGIGNRGQNSRVIGHDDMESTVGAALDFKRVGAPAAQTTSHHWTASVVSSK
jgi:hypothetical protein